jgi:hypothetical protein
MTARLALAGLIAVGACSPPVLTVAATPATAKIYKYLPSGDSLLVGTGTATVKFDDGQPKISMVVLAEGFESVKKTFAPADVTKTAIPIALQNRIVKITTVQPDAEIYVNSQLVGSGRMPYNLRLLPDQSAAVEIRRRGYKSEMHTYTNRAGTDVPPAAANFDLSMRTVSLKTIPTTGTTIEQAGQPVGEGSAQILVAKNACQTIRVKRAGFVPQERTYCQRDGEPNPPESETFTLRDRLVNLTTQPANADIWVGGKKVAAGEYPLTVKEGTCVEVQFQANAFLPYSREYCNQANSTPAPENDFVKLNSDESWTFSTASDQANVNFSIDVNPQLTAENAWKLVAQIATQNFDVIEVTDQATGYLRTGWNVWQRNGGRVIRTRVIVKQSSTAPLRYTIKLQSEYAPPGTSIKDDERFQPWDRILLTYKDLINEAQSRLR